MYVPEHFEETDTARLHSLIQSHGFGTLVVADQSGIEANHLPFFLNTPDTTTLGNLECHVARANPVWKQIEAGANILVIFQGPDAYISPSWYPTKKQTGQVVPTWNFTAVHVTGQARVIHDAKWLFGHLGRLTDHHEAQMAEPWSVADAPPGFTEKLVRHIVGLEITIEQLTGKRKSSQNQPEANRTGVSQGLAQTGTERASEMARLIR